MRPVPYHPQIDDHTCGPASTQMALVAFGIHVSQEDLDRELATPRDPDKGTDPQTIAHVVRAHGLHATIIEPATLADISHALAADAVVIICYTEPYGDGHYAVVTNLDDTHITLADPSHGPEFKIQRDDFDRDWRDPKYTKTNHWMLRVSSF